MKIINREEKINRTVPNIIIVAFFCTIICLMNLGRIQLCYADNGQEAIRRAFDAVSKSFPDSDQPWEKLFAMHTNLWDAVDKEVVRMLNAGHTLEEVRKLHTLIDDSAYSDWEPAEITDEKEYIPQGPPDFWIFHAEQNNELIIGCYNFMYFSPGRISVYKKQGGLWRTIGIVNGRCPIQPFMLYSKESMIGFISVEERAYGDRIEADIELWQLKACKLVNKSLSKLLPSVLDYRINYTRDTLTVESLDLIGCHCGLLQSERRKNKLVFRVVENDIKVQRIPLTPWLDTLDRIYCGAKDRRPSIRKYFRNFSHLKLLLKADENCASVQTQKGDLEKGTATVEVEYGRFTIDFFRNTEGIWKIVSVKRTNE